MRKYAQTCNRPIAKIGKAANRVGGMTSTALGPPYDAPPIIEAVVQLRFAEPVSKSVFKKLLKRLKREYANELPQIAKGASIDFETEKTSFSTEQQSKLSSQDEADVLVVGEAVLSWSRLAPYEDWQSLWERVKREVQIAHDLTGFRKLARIGVRYINRIDVPSEGEIARYENYLTINLTLPPLCEAVNNYGWRFEREFPELGLRAIVQSAVVAPEIPRHAAFLLDIDVGAMQDLPTRLDELEPFLGKMRKLKNDIFELSITPEARASFSR